MPLPKPVKNETEDAFINRCMSNDTMNSEYPDNKQRVAVCNSLWSRKNMNTLIVELFAVGKWNGQKFTLTDLNEIVDNFNYISSANYVPLKLGHDEDQPLTDGEPQLGEVSRIWVDKGKDGDYKLMGELIDLPMIVYNAIKKKLYKKVSIELDLGVSYKSKFMKYVLKGVALLGASLPAVNTLADLQAYMSTRTSLFSSNKNVLCFSKSNFNINQSEFKTMNEEEYKAKIAQLETENLGLKTEVKTKSDSLATFTAEQKKREEDEKKQAVLTARSTVTALFEKAVTDKCITPAQRDQFTKVLNVNDDEAVVNINVDEVKKLIASEGETALFTKGKARSNDNHDERNNDDAGADLTAKAYEIQNANNGMNFESALKRAMQANPELAKEHMINKAV